LSDTAAGRIKDIIIRGGENDMDPYFNINNSGATNLTLGQNELQEATVISNAYSGQYGTFSGAQVSYVTRSGTNDFHGNATYLWNGRALNANDWFSNVFGDPRPFSNANQWAAALAGPIIKNKLFFFVNNEGLRFVLPNTDLVISPTPAFANAVLANVAATQPAEFNLYQRMFNLYAAAPGQNNVTPLNTASCGTLTLSGFNPATTPCAQEYEAQPSAQASEWILSTRVDYKISDKDSAYFRWRLDHGTQPTSVNPISSAFDALSNQPAYDNQFSETHIFGPRSTNVFLAAVSHYVAQFAENPAAEFAAFPEGIENSGSVPFSNINGNAGAFPQGRNVTQYQFSDDVTIIEGKHDLKFGANFRRYDVSDHNFFNNTPTVVFGVVPNGLQEFADGTAWEYARTLNQATDVPIALWGLGLYVNDDWHVKSNLKITLALRTERNSNPVCQFNCFANFTGPFSSLASVTSSDQANVPYSSDINDGLHKAFQGVDALDLSPRVGVSWSPGHDSKTVISGGYGIFYDALSAGLLDNLLGNPPVSVGINVRPTAGTLPFDPNGAPATWAASANAFNIQNSYGQIASTLAGLGSSFAVPNFTSINGTIHAPRVQEWNFQIQRQLSNSVVVSADYVGNHASRIVYNSSWANAYDEFGLYPGVRGIPTAPADGNYGTVTQWQSGGISNYDGLTLSARKQFAHGLTAHLNYTWSHALDDVSNGGAFQYGGNTTTGGQLNPAGLSILNYGNADYDIRHNLSGDWVYVPSIHFGNEFVKQLLGGWEWSGKIYFRTGFPFSVTDNNSGLGNYGGQIFATYTGTMAGASSSCGAATAAVPGGGTCLNANAFVNSAVAGFTGYTGLSTQDRNQFRGPNYFNSDMAIYRTFKLRESMALKVGIQAFNIFNHPNFGLPDSGVGDATFGQVTSLAPTPTSPYGSGLGFDSSPRVLQLSGKFTF
ncbi:MAG: hypothetical protein ABSF22_08545, partial [Bryobacteraceae bacterium]